MSHRNALDTATHIVRRGFSLSDFCDKSGTSYSTREFAEMDSKVSRRTSISFAEVLEDSTSLLFLLPSLQNSDEKQIRDY